jgi:hypothetical protein
MWYFRIIVLRDLVSTLGKRVIKRSVGTREPSLAYERGQAVSVPAVQNLFYLLSRHSALLQELTEHNKGCLAL